jgi:L-ascorbate metabolism protein UlaG (beta-lactamase superfamily)
MTFSILFPMRPFTWVLIAILAALIGLIVAACFLFSVPRYHGALSDHFDGKRFFNIDSQASSKGVPSARRHGLFSFLRWRFTHAPGAWLSWVDLPLGPPPPARVAGGAMRITWINHSSFLLQMDGLNILIDPTWSERASPLSWLGPRRHEPPGIRFEDLPPIDAVLITHNHYDHLDLPTLRRLAEQHHPRFLIGLGNRPLLEKAGITWSEELDWWDGAEFAGGVVVNFVPARHFSARSLCDRNRTLWGGFVIRGQEGYAYISGDTGMGPHFAEIRSHFGEPRLAMLPIGAYLPQWFMRPYHLSPAEAIEATETLGAATTVVSHFGTFQLGDDGQFQGEEELADILVSRPELAKHIWILTPGEGQDVPPVADAPSTQKR